MHASSTTQRRRAREPPLECTPLECTTTVRAADSEIPIPSSGVWRLFRESFRGLSGVQSSPLSSCADGWVENDAAFEVHCWIAIRPPESERVRDYGSFTVAGSL